MNVLFDTITVNIIYLVEVEIGLNQSRIRLEMYIPENSLELVDSIINSINKAIIKVGELPIRPEPDPKWNDLIGVFEGDANSFVAKWCNAKPETFIFELEDYHNAGGRRILLHGHISQFADSGLTRMTIPSELGIFLSDLEEIDGYRSGCHWPECLNLLRNMKKYLVKLRQFLNAYYGDAFFCNKEFDTFWIDGLVYTPNYLQAKSVEYIYKAGDQGASFKEIKGHLRIKSYRSIYEIFRTNKAGIKLREKIKRINSKYFLKHTLYVRKDSPTS